MTTGSKPRILCIHSFTAHGVVGLKPFISVIGEFLLPVPSLLLTGPGNMAGCRRFEYDFGSMLEGALEAAERADDRLVVFVGYLANAGQLHTVREVLARHREKIVALVVDPVCGDNGRAYVSPALLDAWPLLLAEADWTLPNLTEVELLTSESGEAAATAWRARFLQPRLIVTGWPANGAVETRWYAEGEIVVDRRERVAGHHNGTGDLFAAWWTRRMFLENATPAEAMHDAARAVATSLRARSIEAQVEC